MECGKLELLQTKTKSPEEPFQSIHNLIFMKQEISDEPIIVNKETEGYDTISTEFLQRAEFENNESYNNAHTEHDRNIYFDTLTCQTKEKISQAEITNSNEVEIGDMYLGHTLFSEKYGDMHKCEVCPYQTTHKHYMSRHNLRHKNADEVDIYSCNLCNFKTKYKVSLQNHMSSNRHKTLELGEDNSEIDVHKILLCHLCPYKTRSKNNFCKHIFTHKSPEECTLYKCEICGYETKRKGNLQNHILTHKTLEESKAISCSICDFKTKYQSCMSTHKLTHKDSAEVKMFKCPKCPYQAKYKKSLNRHLTKTKCSEEKISKGELKTSILDHSGTETTSRDTIFEPEVTISSEDNKSQELSKKLEIKFEAKIKPKPEPNLSCLAQTKSSNDIAALLIESKVTIKEETNPVKHCSEKVMDREEIFIKLEKPDSPNRERYIDTEETPLKEEANPVDDCSEQVISREEIFLKVEPPDSPRSEINMDTEETPLKIEQANCAEDTKKTSNIVAISFETNGINNMLKSARKKRKGEALDKTINLEQFPKNKKLLYECSECSYTTNIRNSIKIHELTHKDISEVVVYKCDFCEYTSKFKHNIQSHAKRHNEDIQFFKCDICGFQTKYKTSLTVHIKLHKSSEEVQIYKCHACSYETKFKGHLRSHMLQHVPVDELKLYSCDLCKFKTKFKSGLNQHILKHKDASECVMFKCEFCSFETKYKFYFKKHLKLLHKQGDNLDEEVFKCEFSDCSYETTCKSYFQKHLKKKHKL